MHQECCRQKRATNPSTHRPAEGDGGRAEKMLCRCCALRSRAGQPASRLCWVLARWMGGGRMDTSCTSMHGYVAGMFMQACKSGSRCRCLSSPNTKGGAPAARLAVQSRPLTPFSPSPSSSRARARARSHQPASQESTRSAPGTAHRWSFCSIDSVDPLIPRARQLCRPHFHPNRFVVCPVSHLKSRTTYTICDGLQRVHVSLRRIPPLSLCRGYGDGETNGYCDSAEQPAPPDPTHRFPSNPKFADQRRRRGRERKLRRRLSVPNARSHAPPPRHHQHHLPFRPRPSHTVVLVRRDRAGNTKLV